MDIFELAFAKKLGGGSGSSGGVTIKNQDKTFTENGSYSADSGYTGLGIVKVDVQPKNQDKNITANGTYRADSGYTGLGEVVVAVPPTPPNNQDITVKENGTYTAEDGYSGLGTVTVDVGSAVSVSPKDVNFYDYDGTLLHSYTVEEAQALTELPELPTQPGLICQEWNYDLETIKAYNRALNVGATYITDDGKTRLYITIAAEGRMTVPLYFNQSVANGVTIDWGDGSATETLSGTGDKNTSHTYASIGDYVISLEVADECTLELGRKNTGYFVLGQASNNSGKVYTNMLKKVELGRGVTSITATFFQNYSSFASITIPNSVTSIIGYAFAGCSSLASINIPNSITSITGYLFQNCSSLRVVSIPNSVTSIIDFAFCGCTSLTSINIPNSVTSINVYAFQNCTALTSVIMSNGVTSIGATAFQSCFSLIFINIPNGVTSIGAGTFQNCYPLASISIPNSVTSIGANAFTSCYCMAFYDFTTHTSVPTLANTNAFSGIPSDCKIRVPASLYDEWKAATNWSTYASKIVAV